MKIYMIPMGWDKELAVKAAFKSGADKVCLISTFQKKDHLYSGMDSLTKRVGERVRAELERFVDVDVLEVNFVDVKDIVSKISCYVEENEGAEFKINVATSSRLVAVALGMVACMKGIGLEFSMAGYNPKILKLIEKGEDMHVGFEGVVDVMTLPFSLKFSPKEKRFLSKVGKDGKIMVRDFVGDAKGNIENRLRSEFHYICRKLEKQGVLDVRTKGRVVEARLTQFGEIVVGEV